MQHQVDKCDGVGGVSVDWRVDIAVYSFHIFVQHYCG